MRLGKEEIKELIVEKDSDILSLIYNNILGRVVLNQELGNITGITTALIESIEKLEKSLELFEETGSLEDIENFTYLKMTSSYFSGFISINDYTWYNPEVFESMETLYRTLKRDNEYAYVSIEILDLFSSIIYKRNLNELNKVLIKKLSIPAYMLEYNMFFWISDRFGMNPENQLDENISKVFEEYEPRTALSEKSYYYYGAITTLIKESSNFNYGSFKRDLVHSVSDMIPRILRININIINRKNLDKENELKFKHRLTKIPIFEFLEFLFEADPFNEDISNLKYSKEIQKFLEVSNINSIIDERDRLRILENSDRIVINRLPYNKNIYSRGW